MYVFPHWRIPFITSGFLAPEIFHSAKTDSIFLFSIAYTYLLECKNTLFQTNKQHTLTLFQANKQEITTLFQANNLVWQHFLERINDLILHPKGYKYWNNQSLYTLSGIIPPISVKKVPVAWHKAASVGEAACWDILNYIL